MTGLRVLYGCWPWRWVRALFILLRGARVNMSSSVIGPLNHFHLGRRTFLGARSRLEVRGEGQLKTGRRVWISSDVEAATWTEIRVGDRTTIQRRSTMIGTVRIGRDCLLAPNVFVSSHSHTFDYIPHIAIREQERMLGNGVKDKPVWIQDDCWLGANVVVSPGVVVGRGSIVGANSVVTRDVSPYSVCAGAPARKLRDRLAWVPPNSLSLCVEEDLIYVLSGAPERDPKGTLCGVRFSSDEPLVVALDKHCAYMQVDYESFGLHSVAVGNRLVELADGRGVIKVPIEANPEQSGFLLFEMKVPASSTDRESCVVHSVRVLQD